MLGKYKVKVKVAIVKSQLSKRIKTIISESRPSSATCHAYRWGLATLKYINIALISHII